MTRHDSHHARRWLWLFPLLGACSADTVDLGGGNVGQDLQRGSRCIDSTIIDESVRATNQAEVDALLGCEEVTGDLWVDIFAGAELSPLSALNAVGGSLIIGAYPVPPGSEEWSNAQRAVLAGEVAAIDAQGYLPSLHGLEALERVGDMELYYIAAPNLTAFESLRSVASHADGAFAGQLYLYKTHMISLEGFERVRDVRQLVLVDNFELESLSGISIGSGAIHLNILGSPLITDLSDMAAARGLNTLLLTGTGIKNLDPLAQMTDIETISLSQNPELENIDGIGGLLYIGELFVYSNPKLTHLPALADVFGLDAVTVMDNAELQRISFEFPSISEGRSLRGEPLIESADYFDIGGNPKLEVLSIGGGLTLASHVVVYDNASLTSIGLGNLRKLDTLDVADNAALTTLVAGELQTVDSLSVTNNPLLSTAPLDGVRTFESELRGNADGAVPPAPATPLPAPPAP